MISNLLLLYCINKPNNESGILSFVKAFIIWTSLIYVSILGLSAVHELRYVSVAGLYIVVNGVLLYSARKKQILSLACIRVAVTRLKSALTDTVYGIIDGLKGNIDRKTDTILQLFIICYVLGLGIVAFFAVPYNYDSVSYHAPRICQWVQNRSIEYYASHITRQNVSTTLASYISTYLYILSGEYEPTMCIIQYVAYIINLIVIDNVMIKFGCNSIIRRIGQILWITLPIGFAEAITPQNDQLAATWLLLFFVLLLSYIDNYVYEKGEEKSFVADTLYLASSIGFAYLTKPAVCIAMLIVYIVYVIWIFRGAMRIQQFLLHCILMGLLILILTSPQFYMNYRMLGSVMADNVGKRQLVGTLNPAYLFVNFVKNITFNLAIRVGSIGTDEIVSCFVLFVARILCVDINDITISEDGRIYEFPHLPSFSSDAALNFTATFLVFLTVMLLPRAWKKIKKPEKIYILAAMLSFFVFNIVLRWEVSITRYLIGYYAIIIPAICIVIQNYVLLSKMRIIRVVVAVSILASFMYDVSGEMFNLVAIHPVFPRKSNFAMIHDSISDYLEVSNYIKASNATEIGLIEEESTMEYPLWRLMGKDTKIRHVNLPSSNPSIKYEKYDIIPDVIVSYRDMGETIECHFALYECRLGNDCWYLYERVE